MPRVHREGWKFVLVILVAGLAATPFWYPAGTVAGALALAVALFFRDPDRAVPAEADVAVSPADGVVCAVEDAPPPAEALGPDEPAVPAKRVSVFMSVFDVHINRAPVRATARAIAYRPGAFVSASRDKASERNERQTWTFEDEQGDLWRVAQIAGLIARRIVGFVIEDDPVERGERFGLIRFGSRVDVWLPEGWEPAVQVGQRAVGGETVIARRAAP